MLNRPQVRAVLGQRSETESSIERAAESDAAKAMRAPSMGWETNYTDDQPNPAFGTTIAHRIAKEKSIPFAAALNLVGRVAPPLFGHKPLTRNMSSSAEKQDVLDAIAAIKREEAP